MIRHPLFTSYGLILAMLAAYAGYRGFAYGGVARGTVNPKSVRDNPGAYRPIYTSSPRYYGGK